MDFADYAELRRRAEKRLTVLTVWPLVAFQVIMYALMLMRSPYDLGLPLLATVVSLCFVPAALLIHRRRTAASRAVRRRAIDETLEDSIEMGWPLEDPTPRQLRLMAALLDDDLETRAGIGRVLVWSSVAAVFLWVLTYADASTHQWMGWSTGTSVFFFVAWVALLSVLRAVHGRARRAAEQRVTTALARAGDTMPHKAKRPVEAPWWRDEDDIEKPKRLAEPPDGGQWLGEDGELTDEDYPPRRATRHDL
jgi:hypothetical protein